MTKPLPDLQAVEAQGPDWYCGYCQKIVPHTDQRHGRHDEAKDGCGNALSTASPEASEMPKEWRTPPK